MKTNSIYRKRPAQENKNWNFIKMTIYYFFEFKRTFPLKIDDIEILIFIPSFYITKPKKNHKKYLEIGVAWIVWRLYWKSKKQIL